MQCRSCGTEIADKAIVCYRCGAGTTDPVRSPVPLPPRGSRPSLLPGVVLLVVALTLAVVAGPSGHPAEMTTAAGVSAGAGALLLITRLLRRR